MDSKEIRELIELVSRSNFKTFELEREGFRLRLVKDDGPAAVVSEGAGAASLAAIVGSEGPTAPAVQAPAEAALQAADGLYELHSPIVGTFYSAPSPGSANFVEVGSRVSQGQVLCIVEAMKVMNEIESEIDAEVVEVLVTTGQPVEYGEILFRLRPLS